MSVIVQNQKFCVYSHSIDGEIFYVGMRNPHRPYDRGMRNPRWHTRVEKSGAYEVIIHVWTDDRRTAQRIEREMIETHKPSCNGRLSLDWIAKDEPTLITPAQCRAAE
jgi:hypothetical protein